MAVLMVMEVPGGTIEQYEKVNDMMGIGGDADAPDGLIQHVAGTDGDNLLVIDVWESQQALDRFVTDRLRAALAANDLLSDEQPQILPVHNSFVGAGSEPNVVLIMDMDDLTTDAYDRMTEAMPAHYEMGSNHPAVSHTAARKDSGGMVVVDVWDSPESFGKFAQEAIGPEAAKIGMSPPEPRVIQIHNRIRGRAAQRA
jgi:heme-degrading monooxygenase HmoA